VKLFVVNFQTISRSGGVKSKNTYGGKDSRYKREKTIYTGGKSSGNQNFELGSNKSNFRGVKTSIEGEKSGKLD
jgi:hypothetical protein